MSGDRGAVQVARACFENGVQPALRAVLGKQRVRQALVKRICALLPEVGTWGTVLADDTLLVAYGLGILRMVDEYEGREHSALLAKIEEAVVWYGICSGENAAKDTALAQVIWSNVRHHFSLYTYLTIEETRRLARYVADKDPRVADPRGFPALVAEIVESRVADTYGAPCSRRGREEFFEPCGQLDTRARYASHPPWETIYQN